MMASTSWATPPSRARATHALAGSRRRWVTSFRSRWRAIGWSTGWLARRRGSTTRPISCFTSACAAWYFCWAGARGSAASEPASACCSSVCTRWSPNRCAGCRDGKTYWRPSSVCRPPGGCCATGAPSHPPPPWRCRACCSPSRHCRNRRCWRCRSSGPCRAPRCGRRDVAGCRRRRLPAAWPCWDGLASDSSVRPHRR